MKSRSPAHSLRPSRTQRGSFLLEALISVLIVAFGILGLIGLEARAIQNVDDAQFRSEAVFITNAYIGQMWIADKATMTANFADTAGVGTPYDEFKTWVQQRLPGAIGLNPTVTFTARPPVGAQDVTITVFWRPPGALATHQFQATATIGMN